MTLLTLENIPQMQDEVRALARERGAVILAHNYQVPEIQEVADYVGDSLGLSQQAAATDADTIAFCGVHFMAETASILSPEKTVLLPDPDAGCSLADSITADPAARLEGQAPRRDRRDVRQHHRRGQGGDGLLRDVRQRGRRGRAHLPRARRGHRDPLRPGHVPRRLRREDARAQDARVGRRVPRARRHPPARHHRDARRAPGRGLPDPPRVRLLDLGHGVRRRRRRGPRGRAHALDGRDARLRARRRRPAARRSWRPRPGCCTRCAWLRPTWTSWPPTRRRAAAT